MMKCAKNPRGKPRYYHFVRISEFSYFPRSRAVLILIIIKGDKFEIFL